MLVLAVIRIKCGHVVHDKTAPRLEYPHHLRERERMVLQVCEGLDRIDGVERLVFVGELDVEVAYEEVGCGETRVAVGLVDLG